MQAARDKGLGFEGFRTAVMRGEAAWGCAQAARDKCSGDSALQLLPGGAAGAAAQQFLAAASDSGSAPSAADGAAEASSDGETRAAAAGGAAPAGEPRGAPSAAPSEASAGTACVGRERGGGGGQVQLAGGAMRVFSRT